MNVAIALILEEAARADVRFGPFKSTHEAYGVLAEEVAELLDAIRANNADDIAREAAQVAAVAYRLYELVNSGEPKFMQRSGL